MIPPNIARDIILNGTVRYGVARNVPAEDKDGRPIAIALVVIERDNGSFQTLAIPESKIRFAGEGIIQQEVEQAVGL